MEMEMKGDVEKEVSVIQPTELAVEMDELGEKVVECRPEIGKSRLGGVDGLDGRPG